MRRSASMAGSHTLAIGSTSKRGWSEGSRQNRQASAKSPPSSRLRSHPRVLLGMRDAFVISFRPAAMGSAALLISVCSKCHRPGDSIFWCDLCPIAGIRSTCVASTLSVWIEFWKPDLAMKRCRRRAFARRLARVVLIREQFRFDSNRPIHCANCLLDSRWTKELGDQRNRIGRRKD